MRGLTHHILGQGKASEQADIGISSQQQLYISNFGDCACTVHVHVRGAVTGVLAGC